MSDLTAPHFAYPFKFASNHALEVEQDTQDDVIGCINVLLLVHTGIRPEAPFFGIPDLTFLEQPIGKAYIQDLISSQEPRADLLIIESPDKLDQLIDRINISVGLKGGAQ